MRSMAALRANGVTVLPLVMVTMSLFSCAGQPPSTLGVTGSRLAPCPSSPNCVSSDATALRHVLEPFTLAIPPSEAWPIVRELVLKLPRTQVVADRPAYLHAECRSWLFGFVDDLELHLRPVEGIIAVRSASRLGYSDLGVNRRRVESLRALLIQHGVVR